MKELNVALLIFAALLFFAGGYLLGFGQNIKNDMMFHQITVDKN